jgi:hypothetical protein
VAYNALPFSLIALSRLICIAWLLCALVVGVCVQWQEPKVVLLAEGRKYSPENNRQQTFPDGARPVRAQLVLLDAAPVYHGHGAPRGDGSAGILIPGLLCPDHYLFPLHAWLKLIGHSLGGVIVRSNRGTTSRRHRLRYHSWRSVPRHSRSSQHPERSRIGSRPHSHKSRRWFATRLLHRPLHLRLCRLSAAPCTRVSGRNYDLYLRRRGGALALLQD